MKYYLHSSLLAAAGLMLSPIAQASSFTVNSGSTTTSAQTLGSGSGQTGTIQAGGTLSVSGSTVAVTVSGNNATLDNQGTLQQTGSGRGIRDSSAGVTGLTINNGSVSNSSALIQSADADAVQLRGPITSVVLNNYGTFNSLNASLGGAQAVDFAGILTGSNVINNFAGGILEASNADAVRPGVNGIVNNYGTIRATHTTDPGDDGVDAQQNTGVTVNNFGTGLIEGARHGITGGATDSSVLFTTTVNNDAGGIIRGNDGSGINLDGFNANQTATIVNGGTITGNGITGDGDGIDVDGLVNITNTGIIRSINAFSSTTPAQSEGITVGGGTILNSGTIEGLVSAGNLNAVGRGITLTGNDITSGALAGTREAIYGNAVVTNQTGGLIRGQNDSGIAVEGPASGFTVTINNDAGATIQGGGSATAAIQTGADNDTVTNAGIINGSSSGKAVDLGAGNNTFNIQGGAASVQGDISGGTGGNNALNLNIGSGNSFSYAGSLSNFSAVQVNGGTTRLSGASVYSGATTVNNGTLLATNSTGSATGTGSVEVKSDAALGGTGSVSGPVTVDAGGVLSPGDNGIGALTVGDTDLGQGSIFSIDLDPAHGLADRLNVNGSVSLDHASLLINLLSAPIDGQSFTILTNDGSDPVTGLFSQLFNVSANFGGQNYHFNIDYAFNADGGLVGNDIRLTAAAVPVPAVGWLFAVASASIAGLRRRRV